MRSEFLGAWLMPARIIALVSGLVFVVGCGGAASTASSSVESSDASSTDSEPAESDPQAAAKLLEAGFGQSGEYVWVTSIVQAQSSDAVGRMVTVQFNVLDSSGEILSSTEQLEPFSRDGQKRVLGTQVDLPNARVKAVKVEATVVVGDRFDSMADEVEEIPIGPVRVKKNDYGGSTAIFEISNPTKSVLKETRVGVVCYNKAGKIVGGTSTFPSVIPAGGKIRVDADVTTSGVPAKCAAYAGPGI